VSSQERLDTLEVQVADASAVISKLDALKEAAAQGTKRLEAKVGYRHMLACSLKR
jgi:hypothetical protein